MPTSRATYPVVGSITGQQHLSNVDVLTGGHSLHPLQRAGQIAGPVAPVVPGGPVGGSIGRGPPAAGPNLGLPPLLGLNPIGQMANTRIS